MIKVCIDEYLSKSKIISEYVKQSAIDIIGIANEKRLSMKFRSLKEDADNELGVYFKYTYNNAKNGLAINELAVEVIIESTNRGVEIDDNLRIIQSINHNREIIKTYTYLVTYSNDTEEEIIQAEAVAYLVFKKIVDSMF